MKVKLLSFSIAMIFLFSVYFLVRNYDDAVGNTSNEFKIIWSIASENITATPYCMALSDNEIIVLLSKYNEESPLYHIDLSGEVLKEVIIDEADGIVKLEYVKRETGQVAVNVYNQKMNYFPLLIDINTGKKKKLNDNRSFSTVTYKGNSIPLSESGKSVLLKPQKKDYIEIFSLDYDEVLSTIPNGFAGLIRWHDNKEDAYLFDLGSFKKRIHKIDDESKASYFLSPSYFLSLDGEKIAEIECENNKMHLSVYDVDSADIITHTNLKVSDIFSLTWAPNNEMLAFMGTKDDSHSASLFILDLFGNLREFKYNGYKFYVSLGICWMPDSKSIVTFIVPKSKTNIFNRDSDDRIKEISLAVINIE